MSVNKISVLCMMMFWIGSAMAGNDNIASKQNTLIEVSTNVPEHHSVRNRVKSVVSKKAEVITKQKGCWDDAARYHHVDPWLLYSIAYVESSFNPLAFNDGNRNKTSDIGLMQINSSHLPFLKKHNISKQMLYDACTSTYVGAFILATNIKIYGGVNWNSIGAYNAGTGKKQGAQRMHYAKEVYKAYAMLTKEYYRNN